MLKTHWKVAVVALVMGSLGVVGTWVVGAMVQDHVRTNAMWFEFVEKPRLVQQQREQQKLQQQGQQQALPPVPTSTPLPEEPKKGK